MLSTKQRQKIQDAYRAFLQGKSLKARYGQRHMIAAIAKALGDIKWNSQGERTSKPSVTVIEAGTGTGKTLGYALAAIPMAKALEKTLVLATATVALQEQIVFRDLPDIKKHSNLDFSFTLAKGRRRYVCLSKLDLALQDSANMAMNLGFVTPETEESSAEEQDLKLYETMLQSFASGKWNGDRDSWKDALEEDQWRPLTATHAQCTNRKCSYFRQCPFFKARADMEKANVIITNHDMVLSDLNLGGGAILPTPADCIYIFDEGHHLPPKTLEHFSYATRVKDSERWLEQTRKQLNKLLVQTPLPEPVGGWLEKLSDECLTLIEPHTQVALSLESIAEFKLDETTDTGKVWSYRFPMGVVPEPVIELATQLRSGYRRCTNLSDNITDALKKAVDGDMPGIDAPFAEQFLPQMGSLAQRFDNSANLWESYAVKDEEGKAPYARWLKRTEFHSRQELHVSSSLIEAGQTLHQQLWSRAAAAIVTSATLTALGRFDHFKKRAGIPSTSECLQLPSPFRYAEVASLTIPDLKSDPRYASDHTEEVIDTMPALLKKAQGTLVLFASRRQMWEVFKGLEREVKDDILLQDQHSKQVLLNTHREKIDNGEKSVIFGLASLAEGIDLPGSYCEHVIIAKIPFAVPNDPIEASLAEWVTAQGGNPFMDITVPDASVRLIQSSGRLLRNESDTGTITILDKRLITKQYGKALLSALPPYTRTSA